MSLALWHWHFEISSKCTLRCPRCPREEIPGVLNTELSLEFFKKTFSKQFVLDNIERITFCGNDGDPIYAHDLIPVIEYFKSIKPISITIVTNGSHKKDKFWIQLAKVLNHNDQIFFSVDGYDNKSNNLYRVNSNFEGILKGAKILRRYSDVYMTWASILFKFNQDKIENLKEIANKIGFDYFQITHSNKFGKYNLNYPIEDPLQPDDEYKFKYGNYERDIFKLSNRNPKFNYDKIKKFSSVKEIGNIFPLCFTGLKGVYVDSQGFFYPCCWVATRYPHNKVWEDRKIDLKKTSLINALNTEFCEGKFIEGSDECIHKCSKKFDLTNKNM